MNEVKLSMPEVMQAVIVGVMRQMHNIKAGNTHLYGGHEDQGWQYHIEGAMGELALAKHLGVFWGIGLKGGADVGRHQVRTTSRTGNRLIIHPDDADDERFYLVIGVNGKYQIMGWIMGRDAKDKKYWTDPTGSRPAYFVPSDDLIQ